MSMTIRPSPFSPSVNFIEPPLLKKIECIDCFISFIQGPSGNNLVLKQIKNTSGDEQFLLVLDALACHMAEEMQIPMNQVTIIEPTEVFFQKNLPGFPATLHTMAEGKSTDQLHRNDPYKDIDIHQRFRRKNSLQEKKWGVLPPEQTGLTLSCIQEMARHPDLAGIVALDTFVGNADRSAPNLFYDSTTNQFCGIDMATAFNSNLAKEACRQLQILIEKGITLLPREKEALTKYVDTLKILLEKYPAKIQEDLLDELSQKAGFIEGSSLLDQDVIERIEHHKRCINCNYEHSIKLVTLVYELLKI
ncbi:MAG: hypothetical protein ACRDAI_00400 [Candidatus Rhabdochlamydia sp.]